MVHRYDQSTKYAMLFIYLPSRLYTIIMSPELKQAVEERVNLGHTKEQIASELQAAGYDNESIETIYAAVTEADAATAQTDQTLPRNRDLFKAAWSFMISRLDLVALLAVPTVALGLLEYLNPANTVAGSPSAVLLYLLASVGLVIFAVLIQVAVIYIAIKHATGEVATIKDAIVWARSNFFSWIWLVLLSGLVVMGGWLLFIIPGIIAAVYIAFSQYVFVDEGIRGIAALQRSRQLVYGKFAPVLWRLFVMMVFMVVLFIPAAILAALLAPTASEDTTALVVVVLEGLVSGLVGVLVAYYMTTLYQSLKGMPSTAVAPTSWYKVYAGVGVLAFILIISLPIIFVSAIEEFGASMEVNVAPTQFQLEESAIQADMQAELEAFQQEFQAEFESN